MLTDGGVLNTYSLIKLIKKNNKYNRVHSIGIGSGASPYLINECAKAGKGKSLFIEDNDDMQGSIISLLKASLTPFLDNFSFKYDEKIVESIIPAP